MKRKIKRFIGWSMIASPFIALFIYGIIEIGLWATSCIYTAIICLIVFVKIGTTLIDS